MDESVSTQDRRAGRLLRVRSIPDGPLKRAEKRSDRYCSSTGTGLSPSLFRVGGTTNIALKRNERKNQNKHEGRQIYFFRDDRPCGNAVEASLSPNGVTCNESNPRTNSSLPGKSRNSSTSC
jgi:hypothetical protein